MDRDEEFAPVKCSNPRGICASDGEIDLSCVATDTPEDARTRLSRLHVQWLEAATGQRLPLSSQKEKKFVYCEVSPLISYEGEGLAKDCLQGRDLSKPILLS